MFTTKVMVKMPTHNFLDKLETKRTVNFELVEN